MSKKPTDQQDQQPEQMTPITQLFEDMPISISALGKQLHMSEVTLARIRDGKPTRRPTAAKLLWYFSDLYGQRYNLRNVSGITLLSFKKASKNEVATTETVGNGEQRKEKHAA